MPTTELPFRAGVIQDDTEYGARGYATDSDLIRWVRGRPQVMGGWVEKVSGVQGKARACHEWRRNNSVPYLAIGTHSHLYVHAGNAILDITPLRLATTLAANPVQVFNGNSQATVTKTAHGALVGDTVYIGGLSVVGGRQVGGTSTLLASTQIRTMAGSGLISIPVATGSYAQNQLVRITTPNDIAAITVAEFAKSHRVQILSASGIQFQTDLIANATALGVGTADSLAIQLKPYVILAVTANTFVIDMGANATSNATGGGSGGMVEFDIPVGQVDGGAPEPPTGTTINVPAPQYPRQWHMDNLGEDLITNISAGPIYRWPGGGFTRAEIIPNAPLQVFRVAVTPERILLACGCSNLAGDFDPLLVRNCDIEDVTTWVPTATNSAGDFRLGTGSFVSGVGKRDAGVYLFTDFALYAVRYIGDFAQIYRPEQIGVDCGAIGDHVIAQRENEFYWISPTYQFHVYRGGRPLTLENPNKKWFRDRQTTYQENKIFAFADPLYPAVGWFFAGSGSLECNEYLRLDLPDNQRDPQAGWSMGVWDRLVWSHGGYFVERKPLAVSSDGVLYIHESGFSDDGSPREPFIEYAPFDLQDGGIRAAVSSVTIDLELSEDALVTLRAREEPKAPERTKQLTITASDGQASTRISGRQIGARIAFGGLTYTRLNSFRGDLGGAGSR